MKKILIASLCSLLALTAIGCSNNETQTLNNLDAKLDRVSTIVSGTSSTEVNTVSPMTVDSTSYPIQTMKRNAYNNMIREEELRQDVLATTGYIKSNLNKEYKLGKSKTSALRYLIDNLEEEITSLAGTKTAVKNEVKKIQKHTTVDTVDSNITRASYSQLNNLMQARAVYLLNLQNTMNEICNILDASVNENKAAKEEKSTNSTTNQQKNNTIRRNIDSYNKKVDQNEEESTPTNNINNSYNYGNRPYYNDYYNRDYRFNPNRNTDTFYPRVRNIDTYRYNPNYNGNPYYYNNYGYYPPNNIPANIDQTNNDENCENCSEEECKDCMKIQEDNNTQKIEKNKVISLDYDNNKLDGRHIDKHLKYEEKE